MALKKRSSVKTPARAAAPAVGETAAGEPHGNELDRYDIALLHELQRDARLSNIELAARIGLSAAPVTTPGPTWRRKEGMRRQAWGLKSRCMVESVSARAGAQVAERQRATGLDFAE